MLAKILFTIGLVSAGLLLIILTTIPPSRAGAFGVLAVFLLSYIAILCFMTFIIWSSALLVRRIIKRMHMVRKPYEFTLKKAYYYSTVVSLVPVILVGLQSVGNIGPYELLLITTFVLLGCLYVSRRA